MTTIELTPEAATTAKQILHNLVDWCDQNPVPIGVAQVAAGAAVIAAGLKLGAIEIGRDLIATHFPLSASSGTTGAMIGAPLGAWAGALLGGIGVATGGSAIGVPALLIAGGAAAVFAMTGYTLGDLAGHVISPAVDSIHLVASGSLLIIGAYLLIKGASKVLSGLGVRHMAGTALSSTRVFTITLASGLSAVVASTQAEWRKIQTELLPPPKTITEAAEVLGATAAFGAAGAIAGGAVAASSVTVLGSSTLGAAAVSLGIISAPLWPAVVGAIAFCGVGFTAARTLKYLAKRRQY